MPKTRYLCKSFRSNTLDIIELAQRQLEPLGSVDLETLTNHLTLEGLAGSNEKQRTADLIAKTTTEREGVARADMALRRARLELDITSFRVQEATMLLTLLHGPDS